MTQRTNPTKVVYDEEFVQIIEIDYGQSVGWLAFLTCPDGGIDVLPAEAIMVEQFAVAGVADTWCRVYWLPRQLSASEALYEAPWTYGE